jgi:hypothetical protein
MSELAGRNSHLILAYSGCDEDVGEAALASGGPEGLVASNNGYDWLGTGIYFWEADPDRAHQWAVEAQARHLKRYKKDGTPIRVRRPFAIGAVIKLGTCLDLTTLEGVKLLRAGYELLVLDYKLMRNEDPDLTLPENTKDMDMKGRYLDCAVVNHTCFEYAKTHKKPIDTVRSFFHEGKEVYTTAGFFERTHTQICVREPRNAILGYFRVPK